VTMREISSEAQLGCDALHGRDDMGDMLIEREAKQLGAPFDILALHGGGE
jgi:hypothetical protein